jgi:hypothetical protein
MNGGHRGHHGHGGHHDRGCGCSCRHGASGFQRRFWTKEERIAWLEEYLAELQAEAKGVEERIANMKGAG